MNLADTAGSLLGRGAGVAGDLIRHSREFANTTGLKARLFDKGLEYERLMKQLGAALNGPARAYPELVEEFAELFAEVDRVAAQRQELRDRLSEAEAAADAARPIDIEPIDLDTAAPDEGAQQDNCGDAGATTGRGSN